MRFAPRLLLVGTFLALAAALPGESGEPRMAGVSFNHSLRPESPRWPDGRHYEKYTFRAPAGDDIKVVLVGSQDAPSRDHLSFYMDRGDGLERVHGDGDGFSLELEAERDTDHTFYVVSRLPGMTGAYRLGIATLTVHEPAPVYYHMILEGPLPANEKRRAPLTVLHKGKTIRVRVDATGFQPSLETVQPENGPRTFLAHEQGADFAAVTFSPLDVGKWYILAVNHSSQSGTYRMVIEYPNVLRFVE